MKSNKQNNSFTVTLLYIISLHYLLLLFFLIFLLLSEQENTWLNKLKLQVVPFTRLSETKIHQKACVNFLQQNFTQQHSMELNIHRCYRWPREAS